MVTSTGLWRHAWHQHYATLCTSDDSNVSLHAKLNYLFFLQEWILNLNWKFTRDVDTSFKLLMVLRQRCYGKALPARFWGIACYIIDCWIPNQYNATPWINIFCAFSACCTLNCESESCLWISINCMACAGQLNSDIYNTIEGFWKDLKNLGFYLYKQMTAKVQPQGK